MKKITKLLVPVDFSEPSANSFRYALLLADKIDADIEVLNVVYPQTESLDYQILVARQTEVQLKAARTTLKKFIETGLNAVGPFLKNAPSISSDLELGAPESVIPSVAKRESVSMVVIGSRGEGLTRFDKWIGTVAAATVKNANCPVLVIPNKAQFKAIESMSYATDVQDADPFEIWKALDLIKPFEPKVDIVHVNLKKDGDLKAWQKMDKIKAFFEERNPDLDISVRHIPGDSVEVELNEFVEAQKTDLLVMYQPKHSFWDRLLFKSTTKSMAINTKVPLLVLKSS